eukprot:scaffold221312_cov31-Tisochrysis_lutea.AAC.1
MSEVDCTNAESSMLAWAAPGNETIETAAAAKPAAEARAGRTHGGAPPDSFACWFAHCCPSSGCSGSVRQRRKGCERGIEAEQRSVGVGCASGAM